jgi:N6-adenosine-specific RNA methylase IME4
MSTHELVLPMFSPAAQQPTKRYRTIVVDPPWRYSLRADDPTHRSRAPYPTMTQDELRQIPVGLWAADRAHLFLWVTNAFIGEGLELVRLWGFDYKTMITWLKGRLENGRLIPYLGTGNYFRNNTEHVLFAVRGSLPVLNHDAPTAFIAPRGEHSEKPAAFYDMVMHMSPGPYLDVFARKQRFGWDCWGNEAYCFNEGHAYWHDKENDGD